MMGERPMHYRKDGTPIDVMEWGSLFHDKAYQSVKRTKLPGGKKLVSTVWIGIDHGLGLGGMPLIFETMVFRRPGFDEVDACRWPTEAEAIAGHADLCRYWRQNHRQRRRATRARR